MSPGQISIVYSLSTGTCERYARALHGALSKASATIAIVVAVAAEAEAEAAVVIGRSESCASARSIGSTS